MSDRVSKYYNQMPEKEWNRFVKNAYHRIEFEITKRFISKYVKANFTIADVGGGPGRYSIWLLESGHSVALVDPAKNLLEIAKKEIVDRSLTAGFLGAYEASAIDLKQLPSNKFNLALAFGPFYHLLNPEDRIQAMQEVVRITQPGGYIFSAIINRLCPIRDMMFGFTEGFANELKRDFDEPVRLINEGTYCNLLENPNAFTDAYFAEMTEIPELYGRFGVELIDTFSCEGIASFLDEKTELIYSDPEAWARFIDLVEMTANHPSIVGAGEHSVFIGRKS